MLFHILGEDQCVLYLNLRNIIELPSQTVLPLPAVEESQMHCPLNSDRLIHVDALGWHFIKRHGSKKKLKVMKRYFIINHKYEQSELEEIIIEVL
jgi:hypothetical protein